jgi:hypothetical protein
LRGSIDVPSGQRTWQILYRGCELHANDLARIGINMYDEPGGGTVADITGTTVPYSEFRFVYAIPNDAVVT